MRLLAYGTLAGGLISERWLGQLEPANDEIADWSKMKYKRFVDAADSWGAFQTIVRALDTIAKKHGRRAEANLPGPPYRFALGLRQD